MSVLKYGDEVISVLKKKNEKIEAIRKKEILEAVKNVFLTKGYADTVMEDIIVNTKLSRGGVYYYKSKIEILHELMREGMMYRMAKMNEFM